MYRYVRPIILLRACILRPMIMILSYRSGLYYILYDNIPKLILYRIRECGHVIL